MCMCCANSCAGARNSAFAGLDVSSKTTCTLEGAITFGADKAFGKRNVSGRCLLVRAGFAMLR